MIFLCVICGVVLVGGIIGVLLAKNKSIKGFLVSLTLTGMVCGSLIFRILITLLLYYLIFKLGGCLCC